MDDQPVWATVDFDEHNHLIPNPRDIEGGRWRTACDRLTRSLCTPATPHRPNCPACPAPPTPMEPTVPDQPAPPVPAVFDAAPPDLPSLDADLRYAHQLLHSAGGTNDEQVAQSCALIAIGLMQRVTLGYLQQRDQAWEERQERWRAEDVERGDDHRAADDALQFRLLEQRRTDEHDLVRFGHDEADRRQTERMADLEQTLRDGIRSPDLREEAGRAHAGLLARSTQPRAPEPRPNLGGTEDGPRQ